MSNPAAPAGSPRARPPGPQPATIAAERARRARDCVQELERLASRYPDLARHLRKAIRDIMQEAGRTPASDRDLILRAVEEGCHTFAEVTGHTNLPRSTVYKLVRTHPLAALFELRESLPVPEPGRGGRRRPEILIFFKR